MNMLIVKHQNKVPREFLIEHLHKMSLPDLRSLVLGAHLYIPVLFDGRTLEQRVFPFWNNNTGEFRLYHPNGAPMLIIHTVKG